jgi:hypothetical protein
VGETVTSSHDSYKNHADALVSVCTLISMIKDPQFEPDELLRFYRIAVKDMATSEELEILQSLIEEVRPDLVQHFT